MAYFPKKWIIKKPDLALVQEISEKLNVSWSVASVIVNRGINSVRDADVFLNPNFFDLENPFLINDMDRAVRRLRQAVDNSEKVLIYGDRDVDGVSAVCVLLHTLRSFGLAAEWYIPSEAGYGLHTSIIEKYLHSGVRLLVTVDCGISNHQEVSFARSKGIDVIVTDHHEPPDTLPLDAYAIVNPKMKGNECPFKEIAGCEVALKLAQGLLISYEDYYNRDMVVLDIETTGLHPVLDEIVEIAAVKVRNFVVQDKFHSLVRPNKGIPSEVINIHGITEDMCAGAPGIKSALEKLFDFTGDATLIAHNADFDLGFINHYAKMVMGKTLDNPVIDTLLLSRDFFQFRSHALGSLTRDLGMKIVHQHRALDDALATLKVYERLEQIRNTKIRFFLQEHLDMVCLGTIADMVPLVSENRILVKHGLSALKKTRKYGIKLLTERFSSTKPFTAETVAYNIVPLLNSCGRRGRPEMAVELLTTDNRGRAETILEEILSINRERKELQSLNIEKFTESLKQQCDIERDKLFFVVAEGIEHGVTGIVASQIVREYNRPVILLILDGDEAMGAGRTVGGYSIHLMLERCKDILIKFGGHAQAVGLSVHVSKIEELRGRIRKIAEEEIMPELIEPRVEVDAEVELSDINNKLLNEILELEPFGVENPYPVFLVKNVKIEEPGRVGRSSDGRPSSHLKMKVWQDGNCVDAVGWGLGDLCGTLLRTARFADMVVKPQVNRWKDKEQMQLLVVDLKANI